MAVAVAPSGESVPFVAPAFVKTVLASNLFGQRVSTRSYGAATQLPAARVTVVTSGDPSAPVALAVAQVDVWAASEGVAGQLATDLATYWLRILGGPLDEVYVEGAWVESFPRPFDDNPSVYRYLLELGLAITQKD